MAKVYKFARLLTLIRTKSKRKIRQILTFKLLSFTVPLYKLKKKKHSPNCQCILKIYKNDNLCCFLTIFNWKKKICSIFNILWYRAHLKVRFLQSTWRFQVFVSSRVLKIENFFFLQLIDNKKISWVTVYKCLIKSNVKKLELC